MNSWGDRFRLTIWGESHGHQVGVSIDGVPAGIALSEEDFIHDLDRRRAGAAGTTPRKESDAPHIVSGLYNGFTTGSPLTIEFLNENTRSGDYRNLTVHPRPSHADLVAQQKWNGFNDPRGGGHFSGRITLGMVAAGVVAKKILGEGATFTTDITEIGGCTDKEQWATLIEDAQRSHDSLGGIIECRVGGIPTGLGEPFFDSVESLVAHLCSPFLRSRVLSSALALQQQRCAARSITTLSYLPRARPRQTTLVASLAASQTATRLSLA